MRVPRPGQPLVLLGGLTPAQFLRRHWQRKPLLIRGAVPKIEPLLSRTQLFRLAARANVESRLVERTRRGGWALRHGPLAVSALPPVTRRGWTVLVQSVDLHHDAAHALLQSFRFVPDARLDDLLVSWASDGGGVGPHVDSYDVFLLQAHGSRRWRIGRAADASLEEGLPLKILRKFNPEQEHVLAPGDMLYLPPGWAHDGVAVNGDCMTYSIGFRAPRRGELAADLLRRIADAQIDGSAYRDPKLAPGSRPAKIPAALQGFAHHAVRRAATRGEVAAALGESLTEPKPEVQFDAPSRDRPVGACVLDRRTRMLYDDRHVFINGDTYLAAGRDARLLRRLADERCLDARAVLDASSAARSLLREWLRAGWLRPTRRGGL